MEILMELYTSRDNLETYKIAQGSYGFTLKARVLDANDVPLVLSGSSVKLKAKTSRGTVGYWDGKVNANDNTLAEWTAEPALTAEAGTVELVVEVGTGTGAINTLPCQLKVAATPDSEIVSAAENDLQVLKDRAEAAEAATLKAASAAENSEKISEDAKAKESARAEAETERADAEGKRSTAEAARADAESKRVTAEQGRTNAEAARKTAETKRESETQTAVAGANSAAAHAEKSAQAIDDIINSGNIGKAVNESITSKLDKTGGIAGYDNTQEALSGKADIVKNSSAVATVAAWAGTAAPYTQEIAVSGISSASTIGIKPADTATAAQRTAWRAALIDGTAGVNKLALLADGDKPSMDIPLSITLWG